MRISAQPFLSVVGDSGARRSDDCASGSRCLLPVTALLLAGLSFGDVGHFLHLAHFDLLLAGSGTLVVGAPFLGASLFARKHRATVLLWVLALLLQRYVPEASFFLVGRSSPHR